MISLALPTSSAWIGQCIKLRLTRRSLPDCDYELALRYVNFTPVTPHIHLSILISFIYIRDSCPIVVAQVTAPYSRAGLTAVLLIFPFSFTDILRSRNTPQNLFHATLILCVTYVAVPPVSSALEPIYLKM